MHVSGRSLSCCCAAIELRGRHRDVFSLAISQRHVSWGGVSKGRDVIIIEVEVERWAKWYPTVVLPQIKGCIGRRVGEVRKRVHDADWGATA